MEVLSLRTLFMLTGYGAIASTAIHETKSSQEVAELKKLFFDELHEIENRYEDKLEALRGEMVLNNIMLRKTVDELNTKLESERREKSDAMQQLEKKISEKETKLMVEIKDLKNQLITDHNDRNREVDRLKAVILESMPAPKTDLNTPKEKDGIVSKGSLTKGSNWVEDAAKRGTKRDMHELNKEATGIGLKRQTAFSGSTQVAFSARLTIGQTPLMSPNQDIVFNDVLLNVGSAYHSGHGIFVAPVPGVYFFTTSLLALGTTPHHAKLVKDGHELVRADFNDADHFDDSSQAVIVQLEKGNFVAVQNADYSGMLYAGSNYSTFSGFLLYEYEDVSPAVGK